MLHSFSGDKVLSENEAFEEACVKSLIPPNSPFAMLKFVAIPCMIKYGDKNHTRMDIGQIKHRVEEQIHVIIYKPFIHGKITY